MSKPILLDTFCSAGGCSVGYYRAGFDVVGVDINPQPRYPFEFHQGDAIEFIRRHGREFNMVHASPPCQGYSPHVSSQSSRWVPTKGKDEPRLIMATRQALQSVNRPYVIENVYGARDSLIAPFLLCGTMFGLPISRHRLFESNLDLGDMPDHPNCRGVAKRFASARGWDCRDMSVTGKGRRAGTLARWAEIMDIDWTMTQHEMSEAIPPAYTEWIGRQLLDRIWG